MTNNLPSWWQTIVIDLPGKVLDCRPKEGEAARTLSNHLVINSLVVFGLSFFVLGCSDQQMTELKARMGDSEAQFELAMAYYNGEIVEALAQDGRRCGVEVGWSP